MKTEKIKWRSMPDYGDLFTLDTFIKHCQNKLFIDYDGSGVYASDTECTDIIVYPSDICKNNIRKEFTHVLWFNR